ncbi:hypothetical protein HEK131_07590 [Streptomyces seoulensis]|nr:hypothetical protein HEK131_07590 [Streptomyces seoulensis]
MGGDERRGRGSGSGAEHLGTVRAGAIRPGSALSGGHAAQVRHHSARPAFEDEAPGGRQRGPGGAAPGTPAPTSRTMVGRTVGDLPHPAEPLRWGAWQSSMYPKS